MLSNAKQLIEKYALGKRVAAAVSGGEDSMALLSLLLEYARADKLKLVALNVDHCIRPCSAADSAFVEKFCAGNGVELIKKVADIPALCRESGRGTESEAHFARKEFFESVLSEGKADMVATAHHARDNAETVLMHLFRGTGLKGLGGMKTLSGGIFRPFLSTEKQEIQNYVKAKNVPFVVDETNADTSYCRNYIRHEILPRIEQRFPCAERAICRAAGFAAEADEIITRGMEQSAITANPDGSVSLGENYLSAPYIFSALALLGKNADIYYTAVDSVQRLAAQKDCARADIGGGITAAREYGKVTFYYKSEESEIAQTPFVLPDMSASFRVGNTEITVEKVPHAGDCRAAAPLAMTRGANRHCERVYERGNPLRLAHCHCEPSVLPCHCEERSDEAIPAVLSRHCEERSDEAIPFMRTLYFDSDKLPDNCVWRNRRAGDVFTPFGGGRRKLKEYLIDEKIPLRLRNGLALLCSGGEVMAIAGVQVSDKLKVTAESKSVYRISVKRG